MSKYIKRSPAELKNKIFSKLNISQNDDLDQFDSQKILEENASQKQINKILQQTQKKKIGIRKQLANSNSLDFSEEMQLLMSRIDTLKSYSRQGKNQLLNYKSSNLTGKQSAEPNIGQKTFEEMYEMQKKKFAAIRQRRKNKTNDLKYVDMIGKMQLRKQGRKLTSKTKVDEQFRLLNQKIEQQQ